MNYYNQYNLLIDTALKRGTVKGYSEKHHIIPRCMGGSDDEDNLVRLTAREHYVAHLLLVKIYPACGKLIYAANMMCVDSNGGRSSNRKYAWLKEKWIEQLRIDATGRKVSSATREKQSRNSKGANNAMYGLKGSAHPAFGARPWTLYTSCDRSGYLYADIMYEWYHETLKRYKVAGHKRFLKEKNLDLPHKLVRTCLSKISEGWNPSEDQEWLDWKNQYPAS